MGSNTLYNCIQCVIEKQNSGTIFENIIYGPHGIDREQVDFACRYALAEEFIHEGVFSAPMFCPPYIVHRCDSLREVLKGAWRQQSLAGPFFLLYSLRILSHPSTAVRLERSAAPATGQASAPEGLSWHPPGPCSLSAEVLVGRGGISAMVA